MTPIQESNLAMFAVLKVHYDTSYGWILLLFPKFIGLFVGYISFINDMNYFFVAFYAFTAYVVVTQIKNFIIAEMFLRTDISGYLSESKSSDVLSEENGGKKFFLVYMIAKNVNRGFSDSDYTKLKEKIGYR